MKTLSIVMSLLISSIAIAQVCPPQTAPKPTYKCIMKCAATFYTQDRSAWNNNYIIEETGKNLNEVFFKALNSCSRATFKAKISSVSSFMVGPYAVDPKLQNITSRMLYDFQRYAADTHNSCYTID